jgi:hypothetical protein
MDTGRNDMVSGTIPQHIYISIGGQQYGPVDEVQLRGWVQENRIESSTPCWYEGLPQWMPLGEIFPQLFVQSFVTSPPGSPPGSPQEMSPFLAASPGLQPGTPPENPGSSNKWVWILLSLFLILLLLVAVFFLIPQFVGFSSRTPQSVLARCNSVVRFSEGDKSSLSRTGFWDLEFPQVVQNEEKTAIVLNGRTMTVESHREDALSGAAISERLEIKLSGNGATLVQLTWIRKEETRSYVMETQIQARNLSKTKDGSSGFTTFSCRSEECRDQVTIRETVTWPSHPEFNQSIEEAFWDQESQLTVQIGFKKE